MSKHLGLAVLESRWATHREWSVRPVYETLASLKCNNPNAFHYEMFNNAASLKEALPGVAMTRGIRNIVIASHGDERGLVGARDSYISRAVLYGALAAIDKPVEGLFFTGCLIGRKDNVRFLLHGFEDPKGIQIDWVAGYRKEVDWLGAAAFELLFWTEYYKQHRGLRASVKSMERVCTVVRDKAAGLCDELGVGLFVRQRGKARSGKQRLVDLFALSL